MAISFVGSATNSVIDGGASFDITLPSCLENDLVIVVVGGAGPTDVDLGVSTSGYAEIADLFQTEFASMNFSVSWKRMGAIPDTTVTCIGNSYSSAVGTAGIAYVLRGVDTTTALDVTPTTATADNSAIPNGPAITPVTLGSLVVVCGGSSLSDAAVTVPSGYGNHVSINVVDTNSATIAVASKEWNGTGAEDPPAWTLWSSNTLSAWCAVTIALRPVIDTSVTIPSGEMSISGTTPAIGLSPVSGELAIIGGTPVPGLAIPVFPASGTITITGGAPSVSNIPIVMPPSVQMRITGQTPTIEQFMEIAGTTPNMRGSFIFADTIEFSGNTAQMQGDWAFVYPHDFAGETPATTGIFEFGAEFSGETPASTGAFVLEEIQYADFMGNTPVMQGAFEFGAEFSGKTPVMQGSFELEEENWGSFSGKSPAMSGSFDIEQAMDFAGFSPAMEGAFTGDMEQYGSFSGTTPAMDGSFDFLVSEFSFSGLTPEMDGAFVIGEETTMVFSGNTPPSVGEFFIGVDLPTDFTTTSDEVIRYRRGYDNG